MATNKAKFVLRQFQLLRDCVAQSDQELHEIKSPDCEYEEKLSSINAEISQDCQLFDTTRSSETRCKVQARLVDHGRKLERLENAYRNGLQEATTVYEQRIDAFQKHLCKKLIELFNPSQASRASQQSHSAATDENESVATKLPTSSVGGSDEGQDLLSATIPRAYTAGRTKKVRVRLLPLE